MSKLVLADPAGSLQETLFAFSVQSWLIYRQGDSVVCPPHWTPLTETSGLGSQTNTSFSVIVTTVPPSGLQAGSQPLTSVICMVFVGETEGEPDGIAEGLVLGDALGLVEGLADGLELGLIEGEELGETEGELLGDTLGDCDGLVDGLVEGEAEGLRDGLVEGDHDGDWLGDADGIGVVGEELGACDGEVLGELEGLAVGCFDGTLGDCDGMEVGDEVGGGVHPGGPVATASANTSRAASGRAYMRISRRPPLKYWCTLPESIRPRAAFWYVTLVCCGAIPSSFIQSFRVVPSRYNVIFPSRVTVATMCAHSSSKKKSSDVVVSLALSAPFLLIVSSAFW